MGIGAFRKTAIDREKGLLGPLTKGGRENGKEDEQKKREMQRLSG